jgi:hypothetical protein
MRPTKETIQVAWFGRQETNLVGNKLINPLHGHIELPVLVPSMQQLSTVLQPLREVALD